MSWEDLHTPPKALRKMMLNSFLMLRDDLVIEKFQIFRLNAEATHSREAGGLGKQIFGETSKRF